MLNNEYNWNFLCTLLCKYLQLLVYIIFYQSLYLYGIKNQNIFNLSIYICKPDKCCDYLFLYIIPHEGVS